MIERLAVDTNAIVDLMRPGVDVPPPLRDAENIAVPLPVLGELYFGAFSTRRPEHHIALLERETYGWLVLAPDVATARLYGKLRSRQSSVQSISNSKLNDLWIAAICIQHALPLLTNDHGFDTIPELLVIHW